MSYKITLDKALYMMVMWFEALTIALATFIPKMENKLYILFLIVLYLFFIKKIAIHQPYKLLIVNGILLVYIVWTTYRYGFSFVYHLDFYSYVGMSLTFLVFGEEKVINKLEVFVNKRFKLANVIVLLYFLLLLISIVIRDGLRIGFGMSIPVLYGPYSIPHDVAYELLFIYAYMAYTYKKTHTVYSFILKAICVGGIILTGTRSAFLALVFLILLDYVGYKGVRKKLILFLICCGCIVYCAVFTDILITNPITQKTIAALRDTGTVSNSREAFAATVLNAYINDTSIVQKILGIGIEGVRNTLKNEPLVRVAIHAHNDFVNVLCGYGIVGFNILLICLIKIYKFYDNKLICILTGLFLFVLLYTNGLAMYCIVTPLLPMFFLFARSCCKNK